MQPTVSQLTLTSSYQPQFSNTTKHTCTQIFLLTDRQAALFLQTGIFTQLFGCCCHPNTTKNQKPITSFLPPFLLPPSSLSLPLTHTIAKNDPRLYQKFVFSKQEEPLQTSTNSRMPFSSSLLHRHSTRRNQRTSLTLRPETSCSEFIGSPPLEQFMSDFFLQLQR